VDLVKNSPLTISIPISLFKKPPKVMVFTIDNSAYLFKENKQTKNYEASFLLPDKKGKFEFEILIQDKDGVVTRQSANINVDPSGYVFKKVDDQELRINEAKVFLYYLNPQSGQFELWPASLYNQINPVVTDESGEYNFYVPPGKYYLEVLKDGVKEKTGEFEISNQALVNNKIELKLPDFQVAASAKTPSAPNFILLFIKSYWEIFAAAVLLVLLLIIKLIFRK